MEMRAIPAFLPTPTPTTSLRELRERSDTRLFASLGAVGVLAVLAGALAGATVGYPIALVVIGLLVLAILLFRWPVLGFYIVAASAVMVDQQAGFLYVYFWPPSLEGFIERPIGVLVLFVLAVIVLHRFATRQPLLQGGGLIWPYLLFIGVVAFGFVHGLSGGGDLKAAVVAVRPLWYLFISYVLAYNLVTRKEHVQAFVWIVVLGIGFRALLGFSLYVVTYHAHLPPGGELMAHEESFFFASFLLLVVLQVLHARHRKLFAIGLALSPIVLVTMIANQRRTGYIALVLGIVVAWALVIAVRPEVRARLAMIGLCVAVLGAGYVAAFSNSTSTIASPAHAIISAFNPSGDKFTSNLYRSMEDYDTQYTAKQSPLIGVGFGKPFQQPEPLVSVYPQIKQDDPYYNYVPHNNIYWILFSLGLVGFFALWYLFGSMIVRGCLIARQLRDPYLRTVAIFAVGVFCMEIVVAYADYQLFFYRNVFFVGVLAGVLMRLPQLDRATRESEGHCDVPRDAWRSEGADVPNGTPLSALSLLSSRPESGRCGAPQFIGSCVSLCVATTAKCWAWMDAAWQAFGHRARRGRDWPRTLWDRLAICAADAGAGRVMALRTCVGLNPLPYLLVNSSFRRSAPLGAPRPPEVYATMCHHVSRLRPYGTGSPQTPHATLVAGHGETDCNETECSTSPSTRIIATIHCHNRRSSSESSPAPHGALTLRSGRSP